MGGNLYSGVLVFFVSHAKSGTTNNHRNGSSDTSCCSSFSRDSNGVRKIRNFSQCQEKPV